MNEIEHARHSFEVPDKEAVYRAIRSRRDIRRQFTGEPIPAPVLQRLLEAAHPAPSVGFMQPWNFIVIRDGDIKARVKALAREERRSFSATLPPERAARFRDLKAEGILESSLNICITCDPSRGGPHILGKHAIPETDRYSTCLAIANLWLAARGRHRRRVGELLSHQGASRDPGHPRWDRADRLSLRWTRDRVSFRPRPREGRMIAKTQAPLPCLRRAVGQTNRAFRRRWRSDRAASS